MTYTKVFNVNIREKYIKIQISIFELINNVIKYYSTVRKNINKIIVNFENNSAKCQNKTYPNFSLNCFNKFTIPYFN